MDCYCVSSAAIRSASQKRSARTRKRHVLQITDRRRTQIQFSCHSTAPFTSQSIPIHIVDLIRVLTPGRWYTISGFSTVIRRTAAPARLDQHHVRLPIHVRIYQPHPLRLQPILSPAHRNDLCKTERPVHHIKPSPRATRSPRTARRHHVLQRAQDTHAGQWPWPRCGFVSPCCPVI